MISTLKLTPKHLLGNLFSFYGLIIGSFCYGEIHTVDSPKLLEEEIALFDKRNDLNPNQKEVISIKEILCKTAFEYYPFGVIFSKLAPTNLDELNFDTDFCYFYFSPGLEQRSLLKRNNLCDGKTNAKQDFPDYEAYFEDDCKVMRNYINGKVLAFSEPWAPPGIQSYIYTRKTALLSKGSAYMLGCFDLVDDVTLGIAKFKQIPHNALATLPTRGPLDISDTWFSDAFEAFPNGIAIAKEDQTVLYSNKHWVCEETIGNINQLFKKYKFAIEKDSLLASAAWITNALKTPDGQSCDIGTYGIRLENDVIQVFILRPTMDSTANPYWRTQFVQD